MAKIKLQGHASGSGIITLTAPNTSTDRVISLPDATATIATTTDVAARLPSITDGGNATAMTIDSSERIGIGTASPTRTVDINHASTAPDLRLGCDGNDAPMIIMDSDVSTAADAVAHQVFRWNNTDIALISAYAGTDTTNKDDGGLTFKTRTSGSALATRLDLTADGRGLSQFTAKAWAIYSTAGTPSYWGSNYHNTSSFVDHATGDQTINFANAMGSTQFAVVASGGASTTNPSDKNVATVPVNSTSCRIEIYNMGGTHYDLDYVSIIVFAV